MFSVGDKVCLKDEKEKIIYIIISIEEKFCCLKGYSHRIFRKESIDSLEEVVDGLLEKEDKETKKSYDKTMRIKKERSIRKAIFGTVLHIDGDEDFLNSCINLYKELGITAWGLYLKEKEIKKYILKAIDEVTPDIIVMTGHDFFNGKDKKDLNNYENSKEFIQSIRLIRQRFDKDSVIIIAGACASHFEALIASGANFASSPNRINVHTYDPAVIAIRCATTSCNQMVNFESILKYIENSREAYGGIETRGKMKLLL